MPEEIYSPGLEGVVAGETSISTIADGLRYRGYSIEDLAQLIFDLKQVNPKALVSVKLVLVPTIASSRWLEVRGPVK